MAEVGEQPCPGLDQRYLRWCVLLLFVQQLEQRRQRPGFEHTGTALAGDVGKKPRGMVLEIAGRRGEQPRCDRDDASVDDSTRVL